MLFKKRGAAASAEKAGCSPPFFWVLAVQVSLRAERTLTLKKLLHGVADVLALVVGLVVVAAVAQAEVFACQCVGHALVGPLAQEGGVPEVGGLLPLHPIIEIVPFS